MPINPLIALGGRGIDTATPLNSLVNLQQQQQQNAMQTRQIEQQDRVISLREEELLANIDERTLTRLEKDDERRMRNNVIDSLAAKHHLSTGGPEALGGFLQQNRQRNAERGWDSTETDQIIALLAEGKTDEISRMLDFNIQVGERTGIIQRGPDAKAPTRVTRKDGDKTITEQWNESTGQFDVISTAPTFQQGGTEADRVAARRREKINEFQALYGVDQAQATALADGLITTETDPISGQLRFANRATGQISAGVSPLDEDIGTPAEPPPPSTRKTVFSTLRDGVGLVPSAKRAASGITGQVSDDLVAEDEVRAKATLTKLSQEIRSALALSSRPSIFEQQLILENVPSGGMTESPRAEFIKLQTLHDQLNANLADDLEFASDPSNPPKQRQESIARAQAIRRTLSTLGDPSEFEQGETTVTTQEEYDALPSGTEYKTRDGRRAVKP